MGGFRIISPFKSRYRHGEQTLGLMLDGNKAPEVTLAAVTPVFSPIGRTANRTFFHW
jgi:hypothetical protein